nr:penicillin acylase family protein [Gemmatimonadota bacterium]
MTRFALRSLGVAVGLVLVAQVPLAYAEADTLRMAGLSEPVEIIRDRWGIPHIYARNEADLF